MFFSIKRVSVISFLPFCHFFRLFFLLIFEENLLQIDKVLSECLFSFWSLQTYLHSNVLLFFLLEHRLSLIDCLPHLTQLEMETSNTSHRLHIVYALKPRFTPWHHITIPHCIPCNFIPLSHVHYCSFLPAIFPIESSQLEGSLCGHHWRCLPILLISIRNASSLLPLLSWSLRLFLLSWTGRMSWTSLYHWLLYRG